MVYRGCGDYNWLSHWQSVDFPRYPLREMEALQKLYATDACGNKSFRDSVDMSSPLVVVRVSAVLERARHARALSPFVTAHDFDCVAEVGPGACQASSGHFVLSNCCSHSAQAAFVVTSSHWIDISRAQFVWARSIFELDVRGDNPYECDCAANRRPCGVLRSGNHSCLLAHGS